MAEGEEEDKMCRYCFEGEEDGPLISPCECKGGQRYVHLKCLRRWQRMVLVSQPTHPAFYQDDLRHQVCNVCKTGFTCPPPTRHELMESFTGPEIAALIEEGCIIAAAEVFSKNLTNQLEENPMLGLFASYHHWIHGAYLITSVEEDEGKIAVPVREQSELRNITSKIGESLSLKVSDRTYKLSPEGSLSGCDESKLHDSLKTLEAPCSLIFRTTTPISCSDDHVAAVNLTRPLPSPLKPEMISKVVSKLLPKCSGVAHVQIQEYYGGPCDDDEIVTCVVPGGGKGWTIVKTLEQAVLLAAKRAETNDKRGWIAVGQTVKIQGLQNRTDLNGEVGMALSFDESSGRWAVRLCGSGEAKKVKPTNLEGLEGKHGRVLAFWGDARWTRAQLLGEIARGHWGLCRAGVGELIAPPKERRAGLEGRLAFAPVTDMTEGYIREAQRQMESLREGAREATRHAEEEHHSEE